MCTRLRLAEILCRQDYIPNTWENYYIVISKNSIVETILFYFTSAKIHFSWTFIPFGLFTVRQGTTAATNLVLLWQKYRLLFIRNWASKKFKYSGDLPRDWTTSRIPFLPDSRLIFWWYQWQTQLCHNLWPEGAWMTGSNTSATQQLQGVALSSIFPLSQKMP